MYSNNKGLYGLFTLDEMCKVVKECTQTTHLHCRAAGKGEHTAAAPSSPAHLLSRSTNSADLLWKERVGWRASFDCAHPTTKFYSNIKPVLSLNTWKSSQWLTFVADGGVVTIHFATLHSDWEHIQGLFPQPGGSKGMLHHVQQVFA